MYKVGANLQGAAAMRRGCGEVAERLRTQSDLQQKIEQKMCFFYWGRESVCGDERVILRHK